MTRWLGAPLAALLILFGSAALSEARTTAQVYRAGAGIVVPVALSTPKLAVLARAMPGVFIFEAVINAKGRVEDVRVLRSTSKGSARAIVKAVKQWKYKPATLHGKPVPVYLTMVVHLCA